MNVNGVKWRNIRGLARLGQQLKQNHGIQTTGQPQPPGRGAQTGAELLAQPLRCEHLLNTEGHQPLVAGFQQLLGSALVKFGQLRNQLLLEALGSFLR